MWVRGLKQFEQTKCFEIIGVAPYVGAWIETKRLSSSEAPATVAPYVGAWIETCNLFVTFGKVGRTLCGCVD